MKKYRRPKAVEGQIKLQKGKDEEGIVDICVYYGDNTPRCDRALVINAFCSGQLSWDKKLQPSLVEELEKRGYDMDTMRFSIDKKAKDPLPAITSVKLTLKAKVYDVFGGVEWLEIPPSGLGPVAAFQIGRDCVADSVNVKCFLDDNVVSDRDVNIIEAPEGNCGHAICVKSKILQEGTIFTVSVDPNQAGR